METNPFQSPSTELDGSAVTSAETGAELPFFAVGTTKLVVMGLASFSFYNLYWFYRQFARGRDRRGDGTQPFWRAVFAILFCHELFGQVWLSAQAEDVRASFRPGAATAAFALLSLSAYLPSPAWLLGFGALIPLVLVQKTINAIHEKVAPEAEKNAGLSLWNGVVVVLGAAFWLLVIAGLVLEA